MKRIIIYLIFLISFSNAIQCYNGKTYVDIPESKLSEVRYTEYNITHSSFDCKVAYNRYLKVKEIEPVNVSYITKNEKKVIADKYGVNIYKIRDIQIEILNILRENRKNKKEFTPNDSQNFFRYDIPDRYDKFKKYLEEESTEFVEWLFERYKNKFSKINTTYRSYADNHVIRVYNNLKRYLNK